ncbi:hypothetical protein BJ138DRAFT_1134265 [Hygrophoropsis aurantiaca]|uniref:Uncharacterized protein n=1 Tax=Hygrophoropsis aurantiaca TaxID=72124 RepID=A0ACB8AK73_9AGAM|nr:hypothetical protein BJ138DRAFT_1134265 [Hygrophoropsis aurantiaca]
MCNLETEGTKHGCGTRKLRKIDCGSMYCIHSSHHSRNCMDCHCERYFGPDAKEIITFTTTEYCPSCQYWFKGGAQRR